MSLFIKDIEMPTADQGVFTFNIYADGVVTNSDDVIIANAVQSSVDLASVVRCKNCIYSYDDVSGRCCSYGLCVDSVVNDDFYCANGKLGGDSFA